MSIDRDCWRESHKSHARIGIHRMQALLEYGAKEDVLYVLAKNIALLEEIPVSDDESGAIDELLGEGCENLEIAHSMMGGAE